MQIRVIRSVAFVSALALPLGSSLGAQQVLRSTENVLAKPTPPAASAPTAVPALVPYSGFGVGADGRAITGEVPVTFMIYKDEVGGDPLFTESQTAAFDTTGHYAVELGATLSSGIPIDLFGTGEARWLEVQIAGAKAQPRALLVSVPYALKAGDASTLGGLPASAYALAAGSGAAAINPLAITSDTTSTVTTTGGVINKVAKFSGANTIVSSTLYDNGTEVGIGTTSPTSTLSVTGTFAVDGASTLNGALDLNPVGTATSSGGTDSQQLKIYASAYNSSSKVAVTPHFIWQTEPTGNNTSSPGGTLNLLASPNSGGSVETGFYLNTNGTMHFATGQTFPGTGAGTITGVSAGTGLTGGGTSGNVTLAINTGVVPELAGTNSFSGSDTFVKSLYEDLDVNIDNKNANAGGISPGLRLGSASGEGMASKRTSGGNQYGVDLFTDYTSRLAINAAGQVGIGTADTFNGAQLYVVSSTGDGADFYGAETGITGTAGSGGFTGGTFSGGANSGDGISGGDGVEAFGGDALSASNGGIAGIGINAQGGYSYYGQAQEGGYFYGGNSYSGDAGDGIVAIPGYSNSNGAGEYAADLDGNVDITGGVTYDTASMKIDNPLDPANKYLSQTSVQSSEMVSIYSGNITTDEQGLATVQLPSWFETVNGDLRYQLTAIGHKAQAWVSEEVKEGKFQIASDMANVKVSWQITGVRQDAYAKAHPLVVEQDKGVRERGFYRHPELYGQPATRQIAWARHPGAMRSTQLRKQKRQVLAAAKK